ncbi:hypothetical protein LPJ61_000695 [Coemansia biformis]|uniref:Uncharacterized protein n=1 Tax=Coemansia biformis TaxID=1286918 RepID=A0A9W8D0A9_9FUNG|nr:hypothetical protein LPJ61_000695 [Coemansia biformis]
MAGEDSAKRKRPLGLKARAAKKATTDDGAAPAVNDFEESTATIMLQGDENSDELDELEGIFTSAIECADEDPQRAISLLRGTIHESDRLLRISDVDDRQMDARFYLIYGSALYSLTEVSEDDDTLTFLELAHQRLSQADALCMAGGEAEAVVFGRVRLALAKVELAMLAADESRDMPLESLDRAVQALQLASPAADVDAADTEQREGPLAVVSLVLSLVDSQRVGDSAAAELASWCETQARKLPGDKAKHALAQALWLRANALIDCSELGPEIRELFREAQALLADADASDVLILRGEIELNMGNVQEEEEDQERCYAMAVATFKRVQAMGALPDSFAQFVDEIGPADDDDDSDEE